MSSEPGTVLAQQMRQLQRSARQAPPSSRFLATCVACARSLALDELDEAARRLAGLAQDLPAKATNPIYTELLRVYVGCLKKNEGGSRREYLVLSLLTMQAALEDAYGP